MSTNFSDIKKSDNYFFGAKKCGNEYSFTVCAKPEKSLTLNIYSLEGDEIAYISMLEYNIASDVYGIKFKDDSANPGFSYDYTCDGVTFNDPYMTCHTNTRKYKELEDESNTVRAVVKENDYDFGSDTQLKHSFDNIIAYQLHVRGFTKHTSSKVKAKGTYRGVTEKTEYLKELGVNQLVIMPSYEFYEYDTDSKALNRLNYWGFKEGFYFCPKAGYAYDKDFVKEFKDMVKAMHENGIEVIMQFYFPAGVRSGLINDCLSFWYTDYHVDGFVIMGQMLPLNVIFSNPVLFDAKLYVNGINRDDAVFKNQQCGRYICDIDKRLLYDARRFLKGDDDALSRFVMTQCYNPEDIYNLNYITCYEGFTLNDLVSYDKKHNEENNENNADGFSYNISWNCGIEGRTGKKAVKDLRLAQMKNAMCLLLLSKAAPLILMGDEFMNTQNGNNNPYCQDNPVTWLNWNRNQYNTKLFDFVKMLVKFRRDNPIIRKSAQGPGRKSSASDFPAISYHQDNAWQCKYDGYLHHIGIMLSDDTEVLYIAYNMHWENHIFGLPKLKKGYAWKYMFDTSGQAEDEFEVSLDGVQDNICLYKRSIMVLKAVREESGK